MGLRRFRTSEKQVEHTVHILLIVLVLRARGGALVAAGGGHGAGRRGRLAVCVVAVVERVRAWLVLDILPLGYKCINIDPTIL